MAPQGNTSFELNMQKCFREGLQQEGLITAVAFPVLRGGGQGPDLRAFFVLKI